MPALSSFRPGRRCLTRWVTEKGGGVGHLRVRLAPVAGTLVLAGGLLAWVAAPPAGADSSCSGTTTVTCEFFYTGASQNFTVPSNVTQVTIDAVGAAGGGSSDGNQGGLGGEGLATIPVTPGETLQVNVGGDGQPGTSGSPASGGFNGGGPGGIGTANFNGGGAGGGGGGASDVRQGGTGLQNRIVIAGGGGGGGVNNFGIVAFLPNDQCFTDETGGGTSGGSILPRTCLSEDFGGDPCLSTNDAVDGGPGTQTAGGSADTTDGATPGMSGAGGSGGNGTANLLSLFASAGGGGGGGGYYGGGGGGGNNTGLFCPVASGAGGGGSGFTPDGMGMTNGVHAAVPPGAPTGGGVVSISYAAQALTTTSLSSSQNPSVFGQSVTFTATVAPTDGGGTVAFYADGSATPISSCQAVSLTPVTGSSYSATCPTSALPVGAHLITATYSGDNSDLGSSGSLAGGQTVTQAATTTSLSSSQNPSVFGLSVTFTATLAPVAPGAGTPTGTVTFLDGGSAIGTGTVSGGQATFTTSALGAGSHTITASYGGDSDFAGSTGSLTGNPQVVKQAQTTTSLSSSQDPSAPGGQVTYTATISPAPDGGSVAFTDGGTVITGCGSQQVGSGTATCTVTYNSTGSHSIVARYLGDASFAASTSPALGQTVAQCGATLSTCNLTGANLSGANLSGQNLSGTNFKTANLSGANLSNANLSGANLSGANLSGANLSGANLSGANLKGANLSNADLTNANLTGANMAGAVLSGATLNGVTWLNTLCPDGTNSNNDGGTCVGHL
jgi:hypothetical protein